jgi:hypothetical protein
MTSSESAHWARVCEGSTPKASSVVRLLERAVASSARPFDTISRVAMRSATRIGWFQASSTAHMMRSLMFSVCWLTAA